MKKLVIVGAGIAIGLMAALAWKATQPRDQAPVTAASQPTPSATGDAPVAATAPRRASADPDDPEQAYLKAREAEAAKAAAEIIAKHEPDDYVDPEHDHTVNVPSLRRARDAFHRDDYETAIKELEAALAIDPDEKPARALLVEAACTIGDDTLARHHVAKLDPLRQKLAARRCDKLGMVLPGIDWNDGSLPPPPPKGTRRPSPPPKQTGVRARIPIREQPAPQ